jgi:hypothetical protein
MSQVPRGMESRMIRCGDDGIEPCGRTGASAHRLMGCGEPGLAPIGSWGMRRTGASAHRLMGDAESRTPCRSSKLSKVESLQFARANRDNFFSHSS